MIKSYQTYYNTTIIWEIDGLKHREDGPTVEYADGYCQWYIMGKWVDPERAVMDLSFKEKYPELVASMVIYLMHDS
jgi:hypothetical protein